MALAAEEMTRHQEVTEEVQKPCSEILVNLCRSVKVHDGRRATYLEKVMDVMIEKFDGGGVHGGGGHGGANNGSTDSPVSARKNHSHDNPVPPHYYVIQVWSQTGGARGRLVKKLKTQGKNSSLKPKKVSNFLKKILSFLCKK